MRQVGVSILSSLLPLVTKILSRVARVRINNVRNIAVVSDKVIQELNILQKPAKKTIRLIRDLIHSKGDL